MENGLLFTGKENREHQTPLRAKGKQSSREFPSTPAGRVPLADLIDSHEEVREGLPHGTPIEVVSWHKSPQSSDPTQSFMTPMVNRKRKRPRSSSVGISKTERQILDPSDIMTKAPRNDPALELECRYFGNKYRTPSKPASSAAPDFMHSSSPQTPAPATIDTAKLKRTRSCGMAYPSGYKRRKIEENTELHITPPIRKSSIQNEGEMQQISLMLDSIHEEFPGSLRISQISARSASSSTSQRTDGIVQEKEVEEDEEDEVEEDNDVRSVPRPQFQVPDDNMTSDTQAFPLPPRISQKSGESITSYYGDIDEELGGLAEIEGAPDPILKVVHAIIEPPHLQLPPQSAATTHSQFKAAARIVGANEDFGDLQDEEWEMLASMCESGPTQPTTKSNTVARASPDVSTSRQIGEILMSQAKPDTGIIQVSDDEFNDGLDDEFYDELYAATQEPQVDSSVGHSLSKIRER